MPDTTHTTELNSLTKHSKKVAEKGRHGHGV